uniref:Uncharacterized protein n=1 Tax=Solanum lycopersicum TaxID=4081 RepID=A0A3Q7HKW9_SOLLC
MTSGVACHHSPWTTNMVERRRAWHEITALGLHARSDKVRRGMISPPLDSTHGRQHWAWHDITALRQHTWSDDVGHGMTSPPLDNTHGRTTTHSRMTSGVACHHRLWPFDGKHDRTTSGVTCNYRAAHTIKRRRAWHAIIAFGQHKRSNDVSLTQSDGVGRGMPSLPLDGKHGPTTSGVASHYRHWTSSHSQTASGVACHHRPWTANTVERRRAWHAIIALGQHTRSNDVARNMPSPPLRSKHGRMTSGMACHNRLWVWHDITALGQYTRSEDVELGMPSSPLGSTDGQMASGVACQHCLWTAHTVERRRAWHAIITFGQHKRLNDVGPQTVERRRAWHEITALGLHALSNNVRRGMTSPPLYCTHGQKTSGTVKRRRVWHVIAALRKQTRSEDQTRLDDVGHGMPSPPLGSTHSRTTSGVACHHSPWTENTIEQRWALHDITALGLHASSDDVGRGMTSSPLDSPHGRTTSGRAWHAIISFWQHTRLNDVGRGMSSSPFGNTNGRTTSGVESHHRLWTISHNWTASGVACHQSPWTPNTVERCRAWHAITTFGQHTRSNDVGRGMPSCPWTAHMVERRWAWAYTVERHRVWHAIIAFRLANTPSSPLDGKHDRTTSGVACRHRIWTTHIVRRRRAWHAIIAFGQHRRLDGVGRGMSSTPLDSTHGRMTSGVECHHRLWAAQTVERLQAWHAIIALGLHASLDDVGRGMTSPPLDSTYVHMVGNVGRGITSPPLDSTHSRTTSSVACHYRLLAAQTVERHRARHAIITFRQHKTLKQSEGVRRGMPSSPLDDKHGQTKSGMVCHHRLWAAQTVERHWAWHDITALGLHAQTDDVGCGMTSPPLACIDVQTTSGMECHHNPWHEMPLPPLDTTNGRTTSGMACYHRLWAAHTKKQRRAWHDISAFGQHTRSNDVGRDMPSPLLESTIPSNAVGHGMPTSPMGRTNNQSTSGVA